MPASDRPPGCDPTFLSPLPLPCCPVDAVDVDAAELPAPSAEA